MHLWQWLWRNNELTEAWNRTLKLLCIKQSPSWPENFQLFLSQPHSCFYALTFWDIAVENVAFFEKIKEKWNYENNEISKRCAINCWSFVTETWIMYEASLRSTSKSGSFICRFIRFLKIENILSWKQVEPKSSRISVNIEFQANVPVFYGDVRNYPAVHRIDLTSKLMLTATLLLLSQCCESFWNTSLLCSCQSNI